MNEEVDAVNIRNKLDIQEGQKIYFKDEASKDSDYTKSVYEVVNFILEPYGFELYSQNQFKRIAGGSKNSSNEIKNYEEGYGSIKYGYTYLPDIIEYCNKKLDNSLKVPIDKVKEIFDWSKDIVNNGNINLYSSGGERYAIEAIFDLTKGLINEEAFKIDAKRFGYDIELDMDEYTGRLNTDCGQDVKRINGKCPDDVIQIKDSKYFFLVDKEEFYGERSADYFVSYRTQWNKKKTGQKIMNTFMGSKSLFEECSESEYIRVQRKGWAKRRDFRELPKGETYKGKKFSRNNNMFVYYNNLRDMGSLFDQELKNKY